MMDIRPTNTMLSLSAGLLGGAAVVVITALVAPAKAMDPEFGSAINFKWDLEDNLNVTYRPDLDFHGVSISPGVSLDISLRTVSATELRVFGRVSQAADGGMINTQFNIPVLNYNSNPATWDLGYTTPIEGDGVTGSLDFKTTGRFSEGALSDAASSASIGISLDLFEDLTLVTDFGFSERFLGIKRLGIEQNLSFGNSRFKFGLDAPIDFYLGNGSARDPETGYVYQGRGKLGPTQEFGLVSTNVPGPLPILGLGAAFGYSRKLRKRIQSSKAEVISTTSL